MSDDLLSLNEADALARLEASVKSKDPSVAETLSGSSQKAIAKAAKKALYRLKSSGVEVKEPSVKKDAPVAVAASSGDETDLPAIASAIVGTGERAFFLVRKQRGGGLEMYQMVVSDDRGILQLDRGETNRQIYRKHLKSLEKERTLQVSPQRVLTELGIGWAKNLATRTPLPEGAEMLMRRMGVQAIEKPEPLPQPEAGDEAKAAMGHTLHDQVEIMQWLPPEKDIGVLAQRLEEVRHSPLQLTPPQRNEQALGKVQLSSKEFFVGPMREIYARRLWAMGELFEATGRTEAGAIARAEARRLFHLPDAVTRFGEGLFQKVWDMSQPPEEAPAPPPLPPPAAGLGSRPGALPPPSKLIIP